MNWGYFFKFNPSAQMYVLRFTIYSLKIILKMVSKTTQGQLMFRSPASRETSENLNDKNLKKIPV